MCRVLLVSIFVALSVVPSEGYDTIQGATNEVVALGPSPAGAALRSLALPGWGQFATEQPAQGVVLGVVLPVLAVDVAGRLLVREPDLREDLRLAQSAVTRELAALSALTNPVRSDSAAFRRASANASTSRERLLLSKDLRRSQTAWLVGLHLASAADAWEAALWRHEPSGPLRSPLGAGLRSALVPGWGQLHNRRPGKAALLWAALVASGVSLASRQEVVEFYAEEQRRAQAELRGGTFGIAQADVFRKRRNQYVWALGLLWSYQIIDAVVDARLGVVDQPFRLGLAPAAFIGPPGVIALLEW